MRRLLLWSLVAGFVACLNQPTLATITPDFAYFDSDGCTPVLISGHHLGENATVTIGGAPVIGLTPAVNDPSRPDYAQDVGFDYTGFVPASTAGGGVWADVVMTVDGETLTMTEGFYYRTCPGDAQVDSFTIPFSPGYDYYYPDPDYSVDVTQDIQLDGCGLDPAATTVVYTDVATGTETPVPVTSVCSVSQAAADIPDSLPTGDYIVEVVRGETRTRLSPARCGVPASYTFYQYYYDTAGFDCPFDIHVAGGTR